MYPPNDISSQYTNGTTLGGFSKVQKETVDIMLQNLALLESAAVPCLCTA